MKFPKKTFLLALTAVVALMCGCEEQGVKPQSGSGVYKNEYQESDSKIVNQNGIDMFDNSAVIEAYRTGNREGLSQLETDILNEAEKVLDGIKQRTSTPLELELAVHDYIIEWAEYDPEAIDVFGTPQENSDNPYGILIERRGICSGYSSTFQLFMDMAEIPCITICAYSHNNEEHSWNEVCIDGKWYYVDCTWDDPVPDKKGRIIHTFFNVTEKEMIDTYHIWDTAQCYPANSYDASYGNAV